MEKKTVKKSTSTKTKPSVKPEKTIVTKEVAKDYTEILNKLLVCLYVLIAFLVINTGILIFKGTGSSEATTSKTKTEENTEYDVSMFTSVTADDLKENISSSTPKIVYIGRSTCGYCVKFLPALQQAQKNYGYETLYLDITTVTTEDQQEKILELDNDEKFLEQNFGGTPMVLLMKDGKLIDTWIGYAEYSAYASWLEENGFTKK